MGECQAPLTLTLPASMLTELIWVSPVTNALVYLYNITTSLTLPFTATLVPSPTLLLKS